MKIACLINLMCLIKMYELSSYSKNYAYYPNEVVCNDDPLLG